MAVAHQQTDQAIGIQLQSLRIYSGLAVEEAAQHLDLDAGELVAYEAGDIRPGPATLLSMAGCYGVRASQLFAIVAASQPAG